MIRAAKALLLVSAALFLATGQASAQYMATSGTTSQGIFTDQYFTPTGTDPYGQLYFGTGSANGTKLLVAADLSYWPQWSAAAVTPAAPPRYSTNSYFSWPAQYQVDCSENVWIILNQSRICRATDIPVVSAAEKDAFLAKLSAAGLQYSLVYPIKDNGNGRGYVVWTSMDGVNSGTTTGPNMPVYAGYARIEGIGWQNQFQPAYPLGVYRAYGDTAGAFINGLSSPRRETTLRLVAPMISSTIGTDLAGVNATMVTDDWLAGTTTPPTPPAPPVALNPTPSAPSGTTAVPLNIGGSGTGAGGGSASTGGWQPTIGDFDWVGYCSQAKAADGSPRSQAWIQGCLIGH